MATEHPGYANVPKRGSTHWIVLQGTECPECEGRGLEEHAWPAEDGEEPEVSTYRCFLCSGQGTRYHEVHREEGWYGHGTIQKG